MNKKITTATCDENAAKESKLIRVFGHVWH